MSISSTLDGFRYDRGTSALFGRSLRANAPTFISIAAYLAVASLLSRYFGFELDIAGSTPGLTGMLIILGPSMLVGCSIVAFVRERPSRPIAFLIGKIAFGWALPARLLYGLPIILVMPFFFTAFGSMKAAINAMIPFHADPWLALLDRTVHGDDAWRLIQPVVGYPLITSALNAAYVIWFFFVFGTLILMAFAIRRDALRSQFLLAFVLTWALLGSVVATAFASVGPCYYEAFYGDARFSDLMTYLAEVNDTLPLSTVSAQAMLLKAFHASEPGLGRGISAFPSLHVGVSLLLGLTWWQVNRWLGIVGYLYTAIIMIGSVHLGWHYAADGYASLVGVLLIWRASGRLTRVSSS